MGLAQNQDFGLVCQSQREDRPAAPLPMMSTSQRYSTLAFISIIGLD